MQISLSTSHEDMSIRVEIGIQQDDWQPLPGEEAKPKVKLDHDDVSELASEAVSAAIQLYDEKVGGDTIKSSGL